MNDPIYYDRFGVQLDAHAPRLEAYYVRVPDYDEAAVEIERLRGEFDACEQHVKILRERVAKLAHERDALLEQAIADRADAERWRYALTHGFPGYHPPQYPRLSFSEPRQRIGEEKPAYWTAYREGSSVEYRGDTPTAAIDAARGKT